MRAPSGPKPPRRRRRPLGRRIAAPRRPRARGLRTTPLVVGLAALLALAWAAASAPRVTAADIYRCVGADGSMHFSNAPTSNCFKRIIKVDRVRPDAPERAGGAAARGGPPAAIARYDGLIAEVAARHSLEPALIKAVIRAESNFDPHAISHKGAQGLMQLMPTTAARYGVADPFEPRANVEAGVRHLKMLLGLYDGDLRLALAAYNAGQPAVERYGRRVPPYPETQAYVQAVLNHLRAYGGAMLEARR